MKSPHLERCPCCESETMRENYVEDSRSEDNGVISIGFRSEPVSIAIPFCRFMKSLWWRCNTCGCEWKHEEVG